VQQRQLGASVSSYFGIHSQDRIARRSNEAPNDLRATDAILPRDIASISTTNRGADSHSGLYSAVGRAASEQQMLGDDTDEVDPWVRKQAALLN
jgi:hypothetical protein